MARKILLALLFAAFIGGSAFAQAAAAKKNNIIVDAAPLIKGIIASDTDSKTALFGIAADYQYALNKSFSVGGRADVILGKAMNANAFYFGLAAHGRYYLTAILERAFLDAGFGFSTASLNGKTDFFGLSLELKTGYTVPLGKTIRLEPTLAYILAKSGYFPTPVGLQIGLGVGFGF